MRGETAIAWEKEDFEDYRSLRLRVDTMLQTMQEERQEAIDTYADSLCRRASRHFLPARQNAGEVEQAHGYGRRTGKNESVGNLSSITFILSQIYYNSVTEFKSDIMQSIYTEIKRDCFVPRTHYEMQINRDFKLSPFYAVENNEPNFLIPD